MTKRLFSFLRRCASGLGSWVTPVARTWSLENWETLGSLQPSPPSPSRLGSLRGLYPKIRASIPPPPIVVSLGKLGFNRSFYFDTQCYRMPPTKLIHSQGLQPVNSLLMAGLSCGLSVWQHLKAFVHVLSCLVRSCRRSYYDLSKAWWIVLKSLIIMIIFYLNCPYTR